MLTTKDLKDLFGEGSPDRVILKAQRLAAKGRSDQAQAVLKEAIGRLGEVPDLRIEMATLCLSMGRPREAAESLRALLKSSPSQVSRVEEFIGWARTQFSEVESLFEPLAEGHVARRSYAAAMGCLERINRKTLESMLDGRLANLNRFLEKGTLIPKSALPTLYLAALGYEAIGDWSKALDNYRKILTASPGDLPQVDERLKSLVGRHYKVMPLRLAYAELLDGLGQRDRAQEEYLKALEIDPRCASHVSRYFEPLLRDAPEHPGLLWSMVKVQVADGRLDDAVATCGRLVQQGSHLAEIERWLEEVSAAGKDTVDTQLLLGQVSLSLGKVQRAMSCIVAALGNDAGDRGLAALEQVIAVAPGEARAYQLLADCHLREGRVERCIDVYRALRQVDPASGAAIATRLQAVLVADPNNASARRLLEEVCVDSGQAASAVPFLRMRLREGPDQAREVLARLKPMLMSAPADSSLKLAAAEGSCVAGEPETAWGYLQDAIDATAPADTASLHLLVLCAGSSPDLFRRVVSFLGTKASRWCDQPEVVFALAEAAGRAGEVKEAVNRFRRAAVLAPEASAVCGEAIRTVARGGSGSLGSAARAALAEALLDAGEAGAATDLLDGIETVPATAAVRLAERLSAAARNNPGNLALSTGLARVCLASGQIGRAIDIARTALAGREEVESAPLTMTYGDALARSGRPAEAARAYAAAAHRDPALSSEIITRLQHVIQLDMGLDTAHLALGRLLIREGRVQEGVLSLMTSCSIKPDLGPIVLKDLERTSRRHPEEPSVDLARSQLLLEAGDPTGAATALGAQLCRGPETLAEALARLETIASRHPSCARAQVELGRAYLARGWAARASACFMRAHRLDATVTGLIAGPLAELQKKFPDEPEAYIARGSIYEAEGKLVPAAEAYQRAASMGGVRGAGALEGLRRLAGVAGAPGPVHLIRARASRALGEVAEAVAAARQALAVAGDLAGDVRAELDLLASAHPTSSVVRLGRAALLISMLEDEGACVDLLDALKHESTCADEVVVLARRILDRRPSFARAARALAEALLYSGDVRGAERALDTALEGPEASSSLELLLARRELARRSGDAAAAASLLSRAERAAVDRDAFLAHLHREVLRSAKTSARSLSNSDGAPAAVQQAIASGEFARAADLLERSGASPLKAWVLERCDRYVEAGACLSELQEAGGPARSYVALLNRLVGWELEGRAPRLSLETALEFGEMATIDEIPSQPARASEAAHGGRR